MMHTPKCLEQHKISTTNTKKRQQFSGHLTQQAGNYLPSCGHLAQKYIDQLTEDTSQKKTTKTMKDCELQSRFVCVSK